MVFATVPAAPPTEKNHRATSWPAPISANVPYVVASRLRANAFCRVFEAGSSICFDLTVLEDGSDHTTIYSQCCAICCRRYRTANVRNKRSHFFRPYKSFDKGRRASLFKKLLLHLLNSNALFLC